MKTFIIASLALVAFASAHPVDMNGRFDKINSKFDAMYAKFEAMTAEEQVQLLDQLKVKLPVPIQEKIEALTDDQKLKIMEKIGQYHAMPVEERKVVFDEIVAHHHSKMPLKHHGFENIPADVRQKMKERFDALSPAEQEQLKNRIHRKFQDGAMAYEHQATDAEMQAIRERFPRPAPASAIADSQPIRTLPIRVREPTVRDDQVIRERFPRTAPANTGFHPIRNRPIRNREPVDRDGQVIRERFPRPSPAQAQDFQPIRTRGDDVIVRGEWVRDGSRKQRKEAV